MKHAAERVLLEVYFGPIRDGVADDETCACGIHSCDDSLAVSRCRSELVYKGTGTVSALQVGRSERGNWDVRNLPRLALGSHDSTWCQPKHLRKRVSAMHINECLN
jgi:hypothetical protein